MGGGLEVVEGAAQGARPVGRRCLDRHAPGFARDRLEDLGVRPAHDDDARAIAMPVATTLGRLGNRAPRLGAETHRDHPHVAVPRIVRGGHDRVGRLEALAVGHHDQRAIGGRSRRGEQVGPLSQRRSDRAARLADEVGAQIVEEELQRGRIGRERREDVAAARKHDEPQPVGAPGGAQLADLLLHAIEARRLLVGGQHRERHVHRKHHVGALGLARAALAAPPRSPERDRPERPDREHPCRASSTRAPRPGGQQARDQRGVTEAREAEAPAAQVEHERRGDHDRDRDRRAELRDLRHERHHGSGPRHAASRSSSTSAPSAIASGQRYRSVQRTYVLTRIGTRSSRSICS